MYKRGAVGPSKAKGRRSKLSDEPSIILHDHDGKREQLKWMDRAPIIVSCCHSIVYSLSSSGGGGAAWRWAVRALSAGSRRAALRSSTTNCVQKNCSKAPTTNA